MLVVIGGSAGLTFGTYAVRCFLDLFNDTIYFSLPRRSAICLNWHVFAFTAITCIAIGILFSIIRWWQIIRARHIESTLKGSSHRQYTRFRFLLLAAEIGFSIALVIATGVFVPSYAHLQSQNLGFTADDLLAATISLPSSRYATVSQQLEFF